MESIENIWPRRGLLGARKVCKCAAPGPSNMENIQIIKNMENIESIKNLVASDRRRTRERLVDFENMKTVDHT
ncbi:MAG: hypothetical protein AAF741_18930 [Bacteroidota bacterium]